MLLHLAPAAAFYQFDGEDSSLSAKGSIRAMGVVSRNPDDPILYKEKSDSMGGGMVRLNLEGVWGGWLALELNGYALGLHNSAGAKNVSTVTLQPAERSPSLERGIWENEKSKGEAALDWANVRLTLGAFDLKIGRQPVNLASALYFTPNDFFAPFEAETFYRVYKAGVDAARLEASLGGLTQLTLLAVAGYGADPGAINGYGATPDPERASYLGRISTVAWDCEFTALGGKVRRSNVYGGSFQGTIRDWLGLRMEGHWAQPLERGGKGTFEGTMEMERHFPNSLDLRLAALHHGAGVDRAGKYMKYVLSGQLESPYLARWYLAAGAGYQFTPLVTGQALAMVNAVDGSYTLSVNAVYSISNEGELFFGASVPFGDKPEGAALRSEHGARPATGSAEARYYF